jgi:hypothetical protein
VKSGDGRLCAGTDSDGFSNGTALLQLTKQQNGPGRDVHAFSPHDFQATLCWLAGSLISVPRTCSRFGLRIKQGTVLQVVFQAIGATCMMRPFFNIDIRFFFGCRALFSKHWFWPVRPRQPVKFSRHENGRAALSCAGARYCVFNGGCWSAAA